MNYIYFTGYDAEHAGDFVFDITEGYNCHLLLITHTPALPHRRHNGGVPRTLRHALHAPHAYLVQRQHRQLQR